MSQALPFGHGKLWEHKLRKQKQHLFLQSILHRYVLLQNRSQFLFKTLSHNTKDDDKVKRFLRKKFYFKYKYPIDALFKLCILAVKLSSRALNLHKHYFSKLIRSYWLNQLSQIIESNSFLVCQSHLPLLHSTLCFVTLTSKPLLNFLILPMCSILEHSKAFSLTKQHSISRM